MRLQRTIKALLAKEFATRQQSQADSSTAIPPVAKVIASFLASATLATVLGAVWCYFTVSGLVHMGAARAILVFAWLAGTTGIVVSDWIWGKRLIHRIRIGVAASVILAVLLWGLDAWTVRHRPSEIHPIWADFPTSVADYIADRVSVRLNPLLSPPFKSSVGSMTVAFEIAPIVTVHRSYEQTHNLMKGAQYGLMVILHAVNPPGGDPRYIKSLQIVGDESADCLVFIDTLPSPDGSKTEDYYSNECKKRQPFLALSLIAWPKGQSRLTSTDEEFIQFVVSTPTNFPAFLGDVSEYMGFGDTGTRPRYPTVSPYWGYLINFSAYGKADSIGQFPVLRNEVKSGKVKFRVEMDNGIVTVPVANIKTPRILPDFSAAAELPQAMFYGTEDGRASVPKASDPLIPDNHLTLKEIFLSDFSTIMKGHQDHTITRPDGSSLTVTYQAYFDFQGKAKYVGFYIPSSPNTLEICKYLSGEYGRALESGASLSGGVSGQMTADKDLVPTGRVYLYHESDLSIEQQASLVSLYRSKQLDVQFRGLDYMVMHNLSK